MWINPSGTICKINYKNIVLKWNILCNRIMKKLAMDIIFIIACEYIMYGKKD